MTSCPTCKSPSSPVIKMKKGFEGRRCNGCSVLFAHPQPSAEELNEYYSQWLFKLPAAESVDLWRKHASQGAAAVLGEVEALRARPVRAALDFGGGLGFFARALSETIPDVTLFDMSDASRDYVRSQPGSEVTVAETEEEALDRTDYDLILLNQVIEHVPDPASLLGKLGRALSPDGILVASTPNNRMADIFFRRDLLKRYFRISEEPTAATLWKMVTNHWACLDPPRHLFAFDSHSLGEAARLGGLEPARVRSHS